MIFIEWGFSQWNLRILFSRRKVVIEFNLCKYEKNCNFIFPDMFVCFFQVIIEDEVYDMPKVPYLFKV